MRIRKRENLKKKNTAVVVLFLLPLIGFGIYAGGAVYIINEMTSFTFKLPPPDTDEFYDEDEIDMYILAQMADIIETRWDLYHSPNNISVDCTFTNKDYDEVDEYRLTDNGAQWTGMMLSSECLRYETAKNEDDDDEQKEAIRLIKKMVYCFSNLLASANGGIGPKYPGTPNRFYCRPKDKGEFPDMFDDYYKHFNGTGDYHNWRVRLHTSLDEMAGYIMGLGSVIKYVDPDDSRAAEWCYERVGLLVAQLIEGFKKTNWMIIGGDGSPSGSDLNAEFGGGTWKLVLLKMGALVYPELYEADYNYVATKERYMGMTEEGSAMNVVMDYYALAFGVCIQFTLIVLEEDADLQLFYIKQFEASLYNICKYHRNAFVNIAHLIFMDLVDSDEREQFKNADYEDSDVKWDVLDQLWRFHTSGWCPMRNYNLTDRPHSTRKTSLNKEIRKGEIDPTPQMWRDFFENNVFGKLYSWISIEFTFDDHYMLPLTVSEMGIDSLIWEENIFFDKGGNPTGDGLTESTGMSYTIIYWMGRAYDIF